MTPPQMCITGRPMAVLPRLARQMRSAARSTGFGKLCSSIPSDLAIGARGDSAGGVHAADDDHRTGEFRLGHRLQHLDAVAVLEHQVEGHAVEAGRADLFDRLRAGLRQGDDMTGLPGGRGNQLALRAVVIDDQELQGASLAAVRQAWLSWRRLDTDWHCGTLSGLFDCQSIHGRSFSGVKRRAEIQPVSLVIVQELPGLLRFAPPDPARSAHALMESCFEAAPDRFFLFLPFRNWTSISVPLTRTSSQRR